MIKELRKIENAYMELFCQKEPSGSKDFFVNHIVKEMYDHNFTLIRELTNEENMKEYISERLKDLKRNKKEFLKIVFHPSIKLSPEFEAWSAQAGFEVSKINYMYMPVKAGMKRIEETDCVIKLAETVEEIEMGLECAVKFAGQRMLSQLGIKKLKQKRELYLNNSISFYICYVNGSPIGYCDCFQKDGIVKFEEFVILKEYQGKGYGTKMLQKMIHDTVSQGNQHIYVVTDAKGADHNLYYKLGFDFVGEETELFYLE